MNLASTPAAIRKSAILASPLERVWRAISDSHEFGRWFGAVFAAPFDAGTQMHGAIKPTEVDAEVAKLQTPYAGRPFEIFVETIVPMKSISFRWHPYAMDESVDYSREPTTRVDFEIHETPGGTQLVITESGFDQLTPARGAQAYKANEGGWSLQLELIARYCLET